MDGKSPVAKAEMLIRAPVDRVFDAFINPEVTTKFWFTSSSGPLVAGKSVTWFWAMYGLQAEVSVDCVEANQRLVIRWPTPVEWRFTPQGDSATFIEIVADGFEGSAAEQIDAAIDSMGGFNLVLAGCKAWLEHGLELGLIGDKSPHLHV